jgi:hypothetical protein
MEQFDRAVRTRPAPSHEPADIDAPRAAGHRVQYVFSLEWSHQTVGDASIKMITEVMLAIIQKDLQEQKGITATAALKPAHYAAQAIADLGDMNLSGGRETYCGRGGLIFHAFTKRNGCSRPFRFAQRGRLKGENNSQLGSVLPASAR